MAAISVSIRRKRAAAVMLGDELQAVTGNVGCTCLGFADAELNGEGIAVVTDPECPLHGDRIIRMLQKVLEMLGRALL